MGVIYELWDMLEVKECYICTDTENNTEMYICERCDNYYCYSCSASYTIHSQIDYNCCEQCANKNI